MASLNHENSKTSVSQADSDALTEQDISVKISDEDTLGVANQPNLAGI